MALVIILAVVVLATIAVLSFYAHATANRKIEASRSDRVEAEVLSRSAGEYVLDQFLQEIADPSASAKTTVGSVSVFQPLTNTNVVPRRNLSAGIGGTDTNFFSLIRQSTTDPKASGDSTATPSRNGRLLSASRWNGPLLLGGAGFSGTTQLPNWIYVDRSQGVTNAAAAGALGRFAYNVYDVGGLLDANAAGYPTAAMAIVTNLKATVAGADLTQLGLSQAAIDQLAQFRNATAVGTSGGFSNWASASARSGFLSNVVTNVSGGITNTFTNSAFLTRQDLLRYARTQNTAMTNALPYLTHFSRAVNAPSWAPLQNAGTGFAYQTDANAASSTNRFLANVRFVSAGTLSRFRDDGTEETFSVVPGDPLLPRRFSLTKLEWLSHDGPRTGISAAAIKACFGLQWDAAGKQWQYVGSANTLQTSIKALDQVAAEGREPNFFELLKAGVLSGSLGKCGYSGGSRHGFSNGGIEGFERNPTYQLVRIGANLIDQWDGDSYPTAISIGDGAGQPLRLCGIEDIPYFNKVIPVFHWPGAPEFGDVGNPGTPPVYNYLVYELWNPHQPASSTAGPTQFRARVIPGGSYAVSYTKGSNATPVYPMGGPPNDPAYQMPITSAGNADLIFRVSATSSDPQQSYREPRLIRTGVAPRITAFFDNNLDVLQLFTATGTDSLPGRLNGSGGADMNNNAGFNARRIVIALDYLDTDGTYRPYTTFLGHEELPASGWGGVNANGTSPGSPAMSTGNRRAKVLDQGFGKADPRTYRFDASYALASEKSLRPGSSPQEWGWSIAYPEFFGNQYTWGNVAPVSLLARNKPGLSATYPQSYSDVDGVTRPADGYHGDRNPYQAGVQTARPKILNRPFRSSAELGYVFRDMPFKTLDFFSSSSADAALLDLFAISDEPAVVAGRVSLNTPLSQVRRSLLSGAEGITNSAATANSFQSYAFSGASASPTQDLPVNVAELANFAFSSDPSGEVSQLKSEGEAVVRALVGPSQTRTWNLLIDVVAQVGKFPGTPTSQDFVVEGEKRYWISVAIDRFTGKIVDQQWEVVNE